MRLVNADTVADDLKDLIKSGMYPKIIAEKFVPLVHAIQMLPRIEAEPVRRGHWVGIDDFPHETWECDQCGYIHEELGGWVPRYCPDCGAKMEEQE